jgi:hypothetical protein
VGRVVRKVFLSSKNLAMIPCASVSLTWLFGRAAVQSLPKSSWPCRRPYRALAVLHDGGRASLHHISGAAVLTSAGLVAMMSILKNSTALLA